MERYKRISKRNSRKRSRVDDGADVIVNRSEVVQRRLWQIPGGQARKWVWLNCDNLNYINEIELNKSKGI